MAGKGNRNRGQEGENRAVDFLRRKGFHLLERNFRTRGGEIDLIFLDGSVIVFVEVKKRSSAAYGHPIETITSWKMDRLWRTAQFYLFQKGWQERVFRFDLICILGQMDCKDDNILHIRDFLERHARQSHKFRA